MREPVPRAKRHASTPFLHEPAQPDLSYEEQGLEPPQEVDARSAHNQLTAAAQHHATANGKGAPLARR